MTWGAHRDNPEWADEATRIVGDGQRPNVFFVAVHNDQAGVDTESKTIGRFLELDTAIKFADKVKLYTLYFTGRPTAVSIEDRIFGEIWLKEYDRVSHRLYVVDDSIFAKSAEIKYQAELDTFKKELDDRLGESVEVFLS